MRPPRSTATETTYISTCLGVLRTVPDARSTRCMYVYTPPRPTRCWRMVRDIRYPRMRFHRPLPAIRGYWWHAHAVRTVHTCVLYTLYTCRWAGALDGGMRCDEHMHRAARRYAHAHAHAHAHRSASSSSRNNNSNSMYVMTRTMAMFIRRPEPFRSSEHAASDYDGVTEGLGVPGPVEAAGVDGC